MINIPMKFHDPRQNCPPPSSHVIQLTGTIFELNSCIKETNVLSKFHENWAINVTYVHKNAPPTGSHVFTPIPTIFKLVRDINKTNVLTNFHDWAKIVTSSVYKENCPAHWRPYITKTNILTNFELGRDFIGAKLLTKFHEDETRNVASRVFTSKCLRTDGRMDIRRTKTGQKSSLEQSVMPQLTENCSPTSSHVIHLTVTIFELKSRMKETNVLSKFHENWAKNVTSTKNAPTGGHVFSPIPTIFKLVRDINKTNVLTNFMMIGQKLENCHYIHIEKNAPPTGGHVFSPISTIFELVRDIN
ncbi:hypothetical protein DPMN_171330 [Dreissena polymorpha]|uniref:Uncharacterized protein n=1 Tax=Dreissena polymorpha TaxID=45954 RepID=A0A9D4E049_DREPO|nr:hypothetical protein DPMN_171330 [Dreissena polymorpha]